MLLLIPLLPFLGFLLNAGGGRRLAKSAAGTIACAAMLGSFAVAALAVRELLGLPPGSRATAQPVFDWISSGAFNASFNLRLDPLSAVMVLVVTFVGSLIHLYSTAYMLEERDPEFARYFSYLNLFAAFMLVLVLGGNFLVLFVGWEGVGLCSYLLIGFWYEKQSACDAGKKAFIVNRIGDVGFLLGMLMIVAKFGTLDFQDLARSLSGLGAETTFGSVSLITLLLFVGATGKSAQIPLYVWLPDAMEGPTPVSALIHAATMVTAGVYMIGRNAALFSHAPGTLTIIAIVGAATALFASTIGLVQNDIKRVLAYSTVSQLGYMVLAMGVGAYAAGIFHLYTHAFFKALLFLGSGAVIHALAGEQDLRRMGGLKKDLPVTYWTFLVGAFAIAGVPGLAGFFSKDEILTRTFAGGHIFLGTMGLVTSFLTAIYMFRIVFLAFHGERVEAGAEPAPPPQDAARVQTRPHHEDGRVRLHDAPPAMAAALVVLAAGSVLAGYAGVPHALRGSNRFERFLAPSFATGQPDGRGISAVPDQESDATVGENDRQELAMMAGSSLISFAGIGVAMYYFWRKRNAARDLGERFPGVRNVLQNKYYVDEIYDATLVQPIRLLSENGLWKGIDVQAIDRAVNGVAESVGGIGERLRRVQTGSVRAYAASLFLGVVFILGYYLW
jgi:NADH-quinone oxidoreductase subunit L